MTEMIRISAPIDELNLSVMAKSALWNAGIFQVYELASLTGDELFALPRINQQLFDEIKIKLSHHGRALAVPAPRKPSVAPRFP